MGSPYVGDGGICFYNRAPDTCSTAGAQQGEKCKLIANGHHKKWLAAKVNGVCPSAPTGYLENNEWVDAAVVYTQSGE
jgi:hypothetical protein